MEHMAWKGRIKPGCKAEYQRRHAEIWPEMVKVLKEAGICNYSIFIPPCHIRIASAFIQKHKVT